MALNVRIGDGDAAQSKVPQVPATQRDAVPIAPPVSLEGVRILVVDDEIEARKFVTAALEMFGAKTRSAGSAADALSILDEWLPDVLISDVDMPGEDGCDLMRKVRARRAAAGGKVPALALTAHNSNEAFEKVLRAGFQMHRAKPLEVTFLITAVADLIELARRPKDE